MYWQVAQLCVAGRIARIGWQRFCRHKMLTWCERHNVGYIVGIAQNKHLNTLAAQWQQETMDDFTESGVKVRRFNACQYAAKSWRLLRRIIIKTEHTEKGANTRYVVVNLEGQPPLLYDKLYCARGDMENRIKEKQLDLFADRTSCHRWWTNQFRLLLSSLAYIVLESMRRLALQVTELAHAYVGTLRLKLIKSVPSSCATPGVFVSCYQVLVQIKICSSTSQKNFPQDS